jgi:hypothetical protein
MTMTISTDRSTKAVWMAAYLIADAVSVAPPSDADADAKNGPLPTWIHVNST